MHTHIYENEIEELLIINNCMNKIINNNQNNIYLVKMISFYLKNIIIKFFYFCSMMTNEFFIQKNILFQ